MATAYHWQIIRPEWSDNYSSDLAAIAILVDKIICPIKNCANLIKYDQLNKKERFSLLGMQVVILNCNPSTEALKSNLGVQSSFFREDIQGILLRQDEKKTTEMSAGREDKNISRVLKYLFNAQFNTHNAFEGT